MPSTRDAWKAGRLGSYQPFVKNEIEVTRGRLGELGIIAVFGFQELPILMSLTWQAYQIFNNEHTGPDGLYHSAKDALA